MTDQAVGHHVRRSLGSMVQGRIRPFAHWHPTLVLKRIAQRWAQHTLSTRFLIASIFVICTAMLHVGAWVDGRIRQSVVEPAAAASAHYVERVISPLIQSIGASGELSPDAKIAIGSYVSPASKHGVLEIKIWSPEDRLIYASRGPIDATSHVKSSDLTLALSGRVISHFETDHDFNPADTIADGVPVFNIYAPLRDTVSQRVIAVAQIYQDASILSREITIARQQSWLVVGLLTFGMLSLLFGIVHRGSALIFDQQQALQAKVKEQARLLKQNELLRSRLSHAHQSSHMVSDKMLRRVGADLHDGPAQLLGLALLRLDELSPNASESKEAAAALTAVRSATQDALNEIRQISTGLSLPQLENLTAAETVAYAITNHERLTQLPVKRRISSDLPSTVSLPIRTCVFRGVQEGLNNAFHHAGGAGQTVEADFDGLTLRVVVSDSGPGFSANSIQSKDEALGLVGLRHRVESLGGTLELVSLLGKGTSITMNIPCKVGK